MTTINTFQNIRSKVRNGFGSLLSNIKGATDSRRKKDISQKGKAELSSSTMQKESFESGLVKPGYEKTVGFWLLGVAALVYGLICLGAYTRLIKFGHSWSGLHPMEWKGELDSLQKYVEHFLWRKSHGFNLVFLDEYLSTILEKAIGFCFIIPFSYFLLTGKLMPKLRNRCIGLMAMQALQGYIGAWMAVHELHHRPSFREKNIVDTHRFFVHLNTTMLMFGVLLWNGLSLVRSKGKMSDANKKDMMSMKTKVLIAFIIHALNFATGVMVAGIDGSKKFNTFPDMDGHFIPQGYLQEGPIWRDIFENIATVQFHHRLFAICTYITAAYLLIVSRKRNLTDGARYGIWALFAMVNIQLVDGLTVLFTKGHWLPGVFHQSNAICIAAASLFILHSFFMFPSPTSEFRQQSEPTKKAGVKQKTD